MNTFVGTDQSAVYAAKVAGYARWASGIDTSIKIRRYEGRFNIGQLGTDVSQSVTAATKANPAVQTIVNNGCAPGQPVALSAATGGTWSTANGSYTVSVATANTYTINLNSTGLGTLTGATLTYTGSKAYANNLTVASFNSAIVGTYTYSLYQAVVAAGMIEPAIYDFSSGATLNGGQIFSVWNPNIYGTTNSANDPGSPQWQAISAYNHSTN